MTMATPMDEPSVASWSGPSLRLLVEVSRNVQESPGPSARGSLAFGGVADRLAEEGDSEAVWRPRAVVNRCDLEQWVGATAVNGAVQDIRVSDLDRRVHLV